MFYFIIKIDMLTFKSQENDGKVLFYVRFGCFTPESCYKEVNDCEH